MTFGPIDFIVLEFQGNHFHGDIMNDLTELVSDEIIRVLDLVIVKKDKEGKVIVRELKELEPATLQIFDPLKAEISGMVTVDDIKMIEERLENNTTAAIMLFENLWAVKLKQDIIRAKGRLVMQERLPYEVVAEALEDLASQA
jgi:uncharacterized membrane protein